MQYGLSAIAEHLVTINTTNDVVSRKDVPFGGPEKNCTFRPHFPPKTQILGQFLTGLTKFHVKKALTVAILTCKLLLIVIVAP